MKEMQIVAVKLTDQLLETLFLLFAVMLLARVAIYESTGSEGKNIELENVSIRVCLRM